MIQNVILESGYTDKTLRLWVYIKMYSEMLIIKHCKQNPVFKREDFTSLGPYLFIYAKTLGIIHLAG